MVWARAWTRSRSIVIRSRTNARTSAPILRQITGRAPTWLRAMLRKRGPGGLVVWVAPHTHTHKGCLLCAQSLDSINLDRSIKQLIEMPSNQSHTHTRFRQDSAFQPRPPQDHAQEGRVLLCGRQQQQHHQRQRQQKEEGRAIAGSAACLLRAAARCPARAHPRLPAAVGRGLGVKWASVLKAGSFG